MAKRTQYDFALLDKYCKANNVTLLEEYSNFKLNRLSNIKSKCVYENCINDVNKKFRELEKTGSYCINCIKIKKIERRKQSCLEKYGVENVAQTFEVRAKMKNTCINKYGVEYSFQSENTKNKIKNTMMNRYGVENPNQNEDIKNKSKITNIQKYGVEYSSQNKENREKYKKTCIEKFWFSNPSQNNDIKNKKKETCLKNWGVEYPIQNLLIKNKRITTCINNLGVKYPMQNEEVMSKNVKNNYKKKEYIFPSNKIIEIQGYEHLALDELIINEKIDETHIITGCKNVPTIWYKGSDDKLHRHYVDIFISKQNRCIEVKSTWTAKLNNHNIFLKQTAAKELGYKYEIWIYNEKKQKTECYL